jgi:hypothetical protein
MSMNYLTLKTLNRSGAVFPLQQELAHVLNRVSTNITNEISLHLVGLVVDLHNQDMLGLFFFECSRTHQQGLEVQWFGSRVVFQQNHNHNIQAASGSPPFVHSFRAKNLRQK